tara:strand:+ start:1038 stop:1256 length:219 start_codon:yes stop_codon:yes gene_type:complete
MRVKGVMIGDLVTVFTGGWEKRLRDKCHNQAGVVTKIVDGPSKNYPMFIVNFGFAEIEVAGSRIRPLTEEIE